jgi:threonine dehydrogenase-like Zn-dependent dehydrogenase
MRGLSFGGSSTIKVIDVPDPTPGEGEVVLAMKASGMCGSDLKMYRAPYGSLKIARVDLTKATIAGHEPCGVVAAIGPGVTPKEAKIGDRMMVHHYWGCTTCDYCRSGWAQMCCDEVPIVYGISGHGGHAPYMKVPARTLVPLPDELSFEAGAAVSCGTGTAYGGLKRCNVTAADTVVISGQGPVGLAGTQLAAAMGARVIALDINDARLARAKEFGAQHVINPSKDNAVEAIKEITKGRGMRVALETSGAEAARKVALDSMMPWGTLCLIAGGGRIPVDNVSDILSRQYNIIASWTFSNVGQAECARFVAERKIAADKIFTHRWKLEQGEEAYQLFDKQNDGKGVFLM